MAKSGTEAEVRNLDRCVSTVEQILPTLATKVDLERFATKEDLREEGERSRRYMHVLYESLLDKINQVLTGR